jgi:integrase
MLKLYKRDGIWHYAGTVAGRRLRKSTKTADKAIASRLAARAEARAWEGHLSGPEAVLTFAQAAIMYRAAQKSERHLEKIENYWRDRLVKDITAGEIQQSALVLYPNVSGATRNRQVIVPTQAIINHAAKRGLCQRIRVDRFEVMQRVKQPATLEWVERFMEHAPPHLGGLALFMFLTGARIGEALALEWQDVDLQKRTALIRQTKVGSERVAHLPSSLLAALANIRKESGRSIFRYTTKAAASKSWRAAVRRSGLPMLSFHSCRHGFATELLRAGVDVVTVAKLGGWKTPQHVFETYGHASDDITLTDRIAGKPVTQNVLEIARKPYKTGTS